MSPGHSRTLSAHSRRDDVCFEAIAALKRSTFRCGVEFSYPSNWRRKLSLLQIILFYLTQTQSHGMTSNLWTATRRLRLPQPLFVSIWFQTDRSRCRTHRMWFLDHWSSSWFAQVVACQSSPQCTSLSPEIAECFPHTDCLGLNLKVQL